MQEENAQPVIGQSGAGNIWELARFPLVLAGVAAAVTWVVWYFTTEPCTPDLAKAAGCSSSSLAKYINLEVLNKIFTHGAIAFGTGGAYNYIMLRWERQARAAAERRAEAAERRAEAAEKRAEAERQRAEQLRAELTRTANSDQ